jgi:hypothetical protein
MTDSPPRELLWQVPVPFDRPVGDLGPGTVGVGLSLAGGGAHVRFGGEAGLHAVANPGTTDPANPHVLVFVSTDPLATYKPPERVLRRGAIASDETRRSFDLGKGTVYDPHVDRTWTNLWGDWADRLESVVAANMRLRLVRLVVE